MKRKNKYVVCYLAVIAMSFFVLNGCNDDDPEPVQNPKYDLILEVNHQDGGNVVGAGSYEESEQISIAASGEEGWVFVNWIGDTLYVDDPFSANTTVTMPAQDVSITAIFLIGSIVDIDGNVYQSVIIGDQEWMTENLRVSKYNNGDAITTDLSDEDWYYTTEGAYTIYPHDGGGFDDTEGINSDKEMTTAYGKLYNWYVVDDARKLCPKGWKVPNNDDWKKLFNYVISEGFPNEIAHPTGAGHALKSCRQVDSPLGGDCNKNEHPRWNKPYGNRYGFDEFGFSALPAGLFFVEVDDICGGYKGRYFYLGRLGFWWSSSDYSSTNAWHLKMHQDYGLLDYGFTGKKGGFSIRCIRDVED
jgi:uncharacterized protein (TIGR02145 family)